MAIELLTERHGDQIAGVLGCWDRMLIFGTLPKICFAGGMTSFLFERNIRIFDYPRFAEPFRNRIRENAVGIVDFLLFRPAPVSESVHGSGGHHLGAKNSGVQSS